MWKYSRWHPRTIGSEECHLSIYVTRNSPALTYIDSLMLKLTNSPSLTLTHHHLNSLSLSLKLTHASHFKLTHTQQHSLTLIHTHLHSHSLTLMLSLSEMRADFMFLATRQGLTVSGCVNILGKLSQDALMH